MDNLESQDWDILVPIASGVLWNVMVRLGGLDRFLHVVTNGWRKPNNGSRLLRESGYCRWVKSWGWGWEEASKVKKKEEKKENKEREMWVHDGKCIETTWRRLYR